MSDNRNWWRCERGHRLMLKRTWMEDGRLVAEYHPCQLCAAMPLVPNTIPPEWLRRPM